jgi:hypothetical protein
MRHDDVVQTATSPIGESASKRDKLLGIKDKTKDKAKDRTKRALHIESAVDDADKSSYEAGIEELNESPAFNPARFLKRARIGQAGLPARAVSVVQGAIEVIVNPKAAIKSRATRKTAGKLAKSRPYLSRKADLDFLEAHDDLQRAEGSRSRIDDEEEAAQKDGNIGQCEEHIAELERWRQNMRVAWVTARHVQRVRVVDAVPPLPFPDETFFEQQDDCGFTEFNWGKWIAYVSAQKVVRDVQHADIRQKLLMGSHNFTAQYIDDFDELPFDYDTLRRHTERLIIVSAPLQTFISEIRCIYRWEDRARTGKWMTLYFFLWYISHIMTFVVSVSSCSSMANSSRS